MKLIKIPKKYFLSSPFAVTPWVVIWTNKPEIATYGIQVKTYAPIGSKASSLHWLTLNISERIL